MVKWSVKTATGAVKGKVSAGRVKLVPRSETLFMYLTKRDLDTDYLPYDLREEIWTFYGINEPKMAVLLQHILVESDKASIRHLLEKKGITMQETLVDT
ncbi:hypothetical protein B0T25DRAFT_133650 [Lasiosphaeria hispida]|uniref:Uncharacterized protein n=1 Tax=Lasiosphaeria hispida TaxID=260671 RepID=A0AAJ0HSR4_9PEZI|nr:hypothetical protein B0T25DRAFT_133650 [Lasiosphaeria hispida]